MAPDIPAGVWAEVVEAVAKDLVEADDRSKPVSEADRSIQLTQDLSADTS